MKCTCLIICKLNKIAKENGKKKIEKRKNEITT